MVPQQRAPSGLSAKSEDRCRGCRVEGSDSRISSRHEQNKKYIHIIKSSSRIKYSCQSGQGAINVRRYRILGYLGDLQVESCLGP